MAMSRAYLLNELTVLGFVPYIPTGNIFNYIPREFLREGDFVVALSDKGSAIEVTIYQLEKKTVRKFDDYSSAWVSLMELRKAPVIVETKPVKVTRKK